MLTCLHSCQSCSLEVTTSQQHNNPPGGISPDHSKDVTTDGRATESHGFTVFLQYYHALYGLLNELLIHHTSVVMEAIPAYIAAAKHILFATIHFYTFEYCFIIDIKKYNLPIYLLGHGTNFTLQLLRTVIFLWNDRGMSFI